MYGVTGSLKAVPSSPASVTGDDFAHIKGNSSTTVDGGIRVFVNADSSTDDQNYTIEVGNNANVNIQVNKGDVNVSTLGEGDINLNSTGNINMQASGFRLQAQTVDIAVNETWNETVNTSKTESTGAHTMNATTQDINGSSRIDLN